MILQTLLYKINKIYIFFEKYLHISKKSSTFASKFKGAQNMFNNLNKKIMKKFKVIVIGYNNLNADFQSRKAAIMYCEKLWDTFGFDIYLKAEIHNYNK